jgi:hypothetical protein
MAAKVVGIGYTRATRTILRRLIEAKPVWAAPQSSISKGIDVAQQVNIVLVDDLDGSEAHETVTFGLDGSAYEIDLSDRNAKKLRDALSLYTASARRSGRRQARSTSGRSSVDTAAIRAWAKSKGYEVSDRGRISADILEAYKKADKRK